MANAVGERVIDCSPHQSKAPHIRMIVAAQFVNCNSANPVLATSTLDNDTGVGLLMVGTLLHLCSF